jgi:hypothetical protein
MSEISISQMVEKCIILHKLGPYSDLKLISLDWASWLTNPTDKVRCVFHVVGEQFVYGSVSPAFERSEATTINSTRTWGMVG